MAARLIVAVSAFALCTAQNSTASFAPGAALTNTFWGLGAVRHGFDWMAEEVDRGLNDTYRQANFARIAVSRLRIARTWHASDWAMPVWGGPIDFTLPKFEAFAQWVAAMRQANVTVAMAAGWWCAWR